MSLIYTTKDHETIIKHEDEVFEKYSEIIKGYSSAFAQYNCTLKVERRWTNTIIELNSESRLPIGKYDVCNVYCEVERNGRVIQYENEDGETDYCEMCWPISHLYGQFFLFKANLSEDTNEVIEDMESNLRIVSSLYCGGEPMTQVHDNVIKSYTVDFENATLIINTYYQGSKICENTDIIFTEYLTHVFDNEMKGSIILDIEESSFKQLLKSEQELLKKQKNDWPIAYKNEKELVDYLECNKYKAFEICSSYGLNGWVLAKQMDVVEA